MQQKQHKLVTIRGVCAEISSKNIVPKMFIFFTNLTIMTMFLTIVKYFIHYHTACWSSRLYTSLGYLPIQIVNCGENR